jgi:hypothetical protein
MIVSADATDAAGNKVRIAGIFTFHEDTVASENG